MAIKLTDKDALAVSKIKNREWLDLPQSCKVVAKEWLACIEKRQVSCCSKCLRSEMECKKLAAAKEMVEKLRKLGAI